MSTGTIRHVDVKDCAKLVRKALRKQFPETKFSVRSSRYAGGSSIDVRWTDGPILCEVQPIARQYEGGGFDGSIDLAYSRTHWLRADGSTFVHVDEGTEGSSGTVAREDNSALQQVMPDDAEVVRFMADHVFCQREITNFDKQVEEATAWLSENVSLNGMNPIWIEANRMVRIRKPGETWQDVWNLQPYERQG